MSTHYANNEAKKFNGAPLIPSVYIILIDVAATTPVMLTISIFMHGFSNGIAAYTHCVGTTCYMHASYPTTMVNIFKTTILRRRNRVPVATWWTTLLILLVHTLNHVACQQRDPRASGEKGVLVPVSLQVELPVSVGMLLAPSVSASAQRSLEVQSNHLVLQRASDNMCLNSSSWNSVPCEYKPKCVQTKRIPQV